MAGLDPQNNPTSIAGKPVVLSTGYTGTVVGQGVYDAGTGLTTITVPESFLGSDLVGRYFLFDDSLQSYLVSSVPNGNQCLVVGDASGELAGDTYWLADDGQYDGRYCALDPDWRYKVVHSGVNHGGDADTNPVMFDFGAPDAALSLDALDNIMILPSAKERTVGPGCTFMRFGGHSAGCPMISVIPMRRCPKAY
jgi:hypothetical protein